MLCLLPFTQMKKATLLASILVVFTLLLINPLYAEDSSSSGTRNTPGPKVEKRIDTLQNQKDQLTARAQNLKDKIASKEADFKARVTAFKDKAKAQLVTRVNDLLNQINKRRTTEMSSHLDKMSGILDKLKVRVGSASSSALIATKSAESSQSGSVSDAINNAQAAISKAKIGVTAQADKNYTIQVSTESAVRSDAKTQRDALFVDLKATHQLVVDAKNAVSNAIKAAKSLGGFK